jgi:hypothetical protein
MSEFPLVQNDKGDVLGWDGQKWRQPDDVAVNDKGQKAFRFGESWQVEPSAQPPTKAVRNVAPAGKPEQPGALDTARLWGTDIAGGITDAADSAYGAVNPFSYQTRIADWVGKKLFGSDSKSVKDVQEEAARRLGGAKPKSWFPSDVVHSAGIPTDSNAEAKRLGVENSGWRQDVGTGLRIASGGPLMGARLATTAAMGIGGALGHALGGDVGAAAGSIVSPAALALVPGLVRSTASTVSNATRPLRPQGRQEIAENIVRESATDPAAAATALATNRPPLPNAGFTAAEMSGDRGLLGLQRAYMGRPGTVTGGDYAGAQIPDAFIGARTAENAGMNRLLGRMGPYANTDDASVGLANSMRQGTFEPVLRDETRAWNAFRQSSGNQVFDADPLQTAWNNLRRQPNIRPDRDLVPAREYNKLRSIFERGATDLDELQSIRSGLGDARQAALRAGENNRARVIEAHRRVLTDYINNLPVRDPNTLALYQGARNMTRAKNVAFTESNIGKAFERTGQNYDLRATKVADTAFSSREAFNDAMRLGQANPNITRELRRNFVTRLMESARTTAVDLPTGERVLSRAAMDRFLADPVMQHARARLYNTPAKERIWNRIEDALTRMDATNRAKPNVGSNTSHDLQRGSVLDGVLMRWAGKMSGGTVPSIVNRFTDVLYKTSLQEIDGLVASILLNPSAARVALSRPTVQNLRLLQQLSRAPRALVTSSAANASQTQQ